MNTITSAGTRERNARLARIGSGLVGVWLVVSAFLWPHSQSELTNTWLAGALAFVFAIVASLSAPARLMNTALAVWLVVSAFALPYLKIDTVLNNVIAALLLFGFSLVSSRPNVGVAAR